jgi:hypothetical protein
MVEEDLTGVDEKTHLWDVGEVDNKESIECYRCHKLGHYQSECPTWGDNANYAEFNDEEEMLLMATTNYEDVKEENWFLDSGYINHMVGNIDNCISLMRATRIQSNLLMIQRCL